MLLLTSAFWQVGSWPVLAWLPLGGSGVLVVRWLVRFRRRCNPVLLWSLCLFAGLVVVYSVQRSVGALGFLA